MEGSCFLCRGGSGFGKVGFALRRLLCYTGKNVLLPVGIPIRLHQHTEEETYYAHA